MSSFAAALLAAGLGLWTLIAPLASAAAPAPAPAPQGPMPEWLDRAAAEIPKVTDDKEKASLTRLVLTARAALLVDSHQDDRAFALADQAGQDRPSVLTGIAMQQFLRGEPAAAENTVTRIGDPSLADAVWSYMASQSLAGGAAERAAAYAAKITDENARSAAYQQIATDRAINGDVQGALEMSRLITDVDGKAAFEMVYRAAVIAGQKGDLAREAQSHGWKLEDLSQALRGIVEARCRAKNIAGAQQIASQIPDPQARAVAEVAIANAQTRAGDRESAKRSLAAAGQSADQMQGQERDTYGWMVAIMIAWAQRDAGDDTAALATLQRANAPTADGAARPAIGSAVTISVMVDRGQIDAAARMVGQPTDWLQAIPLARALMEDRRYDDLRRWAASLSDADVRAHVYLDAFMYTMKPPEAPTGR